MKDLALSLRMKNRFLSLLLVAFSTMPLLASCGDSQVTSPEQAPRYETGNNGQYAPVPPNQQRARGLSNRQKVAILAGAAALYYLYNQHKNRQAQGAEGQYYLSKNGRVYYRDAQHQVHWVTPPPEGIQVPAEEAQRYQEFQGYNGRSSGRDLKDLVNSGEVAPAY